MTLLKEFCGDDWKQSSFAKVTLSTHVSCKIEALMNATVQHKRYKVSVDEYVRFRREGYLIVRGLLGQDEIAELNAQCDAIWRGEIDIPGHKTSAEMSLEERKLALLRLHQMHFSIELEERYLLHPGILDVVEALVGPDVMAMQTMLFLKEAGSNGQGFHQDGFYIPVFPDTLIGAWIALEPVDEENGCLYMSVGSQHEPIYPPAHGYGYGNVEIKDIQYVENVGGQHNDDDDPLNTLKPIAERYKEHEVPAIMGPGDVVFFGSHVFHRSLKNRSATRSRRALVNHYANARSFTEWGGGNAGQILARGGTHLQYATPKFGTPCAANHPEVSRANVASPSMMMGMPDGTVKAVESVGDADHDH